MKRISSLIIGGFFMVLYTISGCRNCECCGNAAYVLTCTKGSDTVIVAMQPELSFTAEDSLMLYQNQGFSCSLTTPGGPYQSWPVCGPLKIKHFKAIGYLCVSQEECYTN
jgi:hypothetical protein